MINIKAIRWDEWDGGDRQNFKAYLNFSNDIEILKQKYKFDSFTLVNIAVFDNLEELAENSIINLRRTAWHKLTPQERSALNLPVEEPK